MGGITLRVSHSRPDNQHAETMPTTIEQPETRAAVALHPLVMPFTLASCQVCRERLWISHDYGQRMRLKCTCGHSAVIERKNLDETRSA